MKFRARKALLSLTFACAAATAQEETPESPAPAAETTYWKTGYLDAVLALHECPSQGVCGEIYWLNPKDRKIFDYFGDPKKKRRAGPGRTPSENDVAELCGFSPRMHFRKTAPDKWQGEMELRRMGMRVDVNVKVKSDSEMQVVLSKGLFSKKDTWRKAGKDDPRYPQCVKPEKN